MTEPVISFLSRYTDCQEQLMFLLFVFLIMNNVEMTDTELEKLFREWWKESYPTPPGTHALITHLGWGRHLIEKACERSKHRAIE